MEKVKQVGESYELNKLKTQNRTIELDARLANERLFATKIRLHQMNNDNEKLNKQLRLSQQLMREQEKKLLLTETMLRQFVDNGSTTMMPARLDGSSGSSNNHGNNNNSNSNSTNLNGGSAGLATSSNSNNAGKGNSGGGGGGVFAFSRKDRLTGPTLKGGGKLKATASNRQQQPNRLVRFGGGAASRAARRRVRPLGASAPSGARSDSETIIERAGRGASTDRLGRRRHGEQLAADGEPGRHQRQQQPVVVVVSGASTAGAVPLPAGSGDRSATASEPLRNEAGSTSSSAPAAVATQTSRPSRARTIINDLRQRLNLGSNSSSRATGE